MAKRKKYNPEKRAWKGRSYKRGGTVKAILRDPELRKELMVETIVATQAREDIETTKEQAEQAYDTIQKEKSS